MTDSPRTNTRTALAMTGLISLFFYAVCLIHLFGDTFLVRESTLFGTWGIQSFILKRAIYLSPILGVFLVRRFFWSTLRPILIRHRLMLVAALLLTAVLSFPTYMVDFAHKMDWLVIAGMVWRDAVCAPLWAIVFILSLTHKGTTSTEKSNATGVLVFAGILVVLIAKVVAEHGAAARLEDEIAYHVQSLVFESGSTKGRLMLPAALVQPVRHAVFLPYIWTEDDGTFFSAHQHGWSLVLAALSAIKLKWLANALLSLANLLIFRRLALAMCGYVSTTAFILFGFSPLFVVMSTTLMSHALGMTIALLSTLFWWRARSGSFRAGFLLVITLLLGSWVRVQAVVAISAAIFAFEMIQVVIQRSRSSLRTSLFVTSLLGVSGLAAYMCLTLYAADYGMRHPVFLVDYMDKHLLAGCQSLGVGPGHGCFPTYHTMGHSLRKVALNVLDLIGHGNHMFAIVGLPIGSVTAVLLASRWRILREDSNPALFFVLILAVQAGLFAMYFHNGGESFRGRYEFESSFALYLLCGILLDQVGGRPAGSAPAISRRLLAALFVLTLAGVFLQLRGEYISPSRPLTMIPGDAHTSLIVVKNWPNPELEPTGGLIAPNEFDRDSAVHLKPQAVMAFLNQGRATIASAAVRIDDHGMFRDQNNNVLVGDLSLSDAEHLARELGLLAIYELDYGRRSSVREGSGLRITKSVRPQLIPLKTMMSNL